MNTLVRPFADRSRPAGGLVPISVLLGLLVVWSTSLAGAQTARQIMDAVDDRDTGASRYQTGQLILIDADNSKRLRQIAQLAKRYGDDEKAVTQVLSPAEIDGTTILSYDWDDILRDDETWLYLPKLRKSKRLATADTSAYWLGSDFTYADVTGLDIEDFEYQFASGEADDGVLVLDATPLPEKRREVVDETGYKKIRYWVDAERFIVLKAKYWLAEGGQVKYYSASDIKRVDNIWVIGKSQMVLTKGKKVIHASVFTIDEVEFDVDIPDEKFSVQSMRHEL